MIIAAVVLVITIPSILLLVYTQNPAVIIGMIIAEAIVMIVTLLISVFFYYIHPVIIMDDMKAVGGLRRSIEVAKKNYLFTLLILLPFVIIYAIYGVFMGLPMYLGAANYISILSLIIGSIISLFITTWIAIMIPYAYYNIRT